MSLAVSVGSLTSAELAKLNAVLVANGLPEHTEPTSLPEPFTRPNLGSFPYTWLHFLRRAYAYAVNPREVLEPLGQWEDPEDSILNREYEEFSSHLLCHSDTDGFYVPIDFPDPLLGIDEIELEGGVLGSSQAVLRELVVVAPLIGVTLTDGELDDAQAKAIYDEDGDHPFWIERAVWLTFFENASASVRYGTAIHFL